MKISQLIFSLFISMSIYPFFAFAENVPELLGEGSEGYRQGNYRAPVPATLTGATVIDVKAAHQLWKEGKPIFIDVLPRPPRPKNIQDPAKWKAPKRENIKGSVWLPNVGFGSLHPSFEDYYKRNLKRLTKDDKSRRVILYCLADCWMSWNAAKRAMSYGYTNVVWFPGGSTDWDAAGYPLEEKLPEEHQN